MKKIRIGIELDHVIRDVNRQIVKYYQRDYDESIDLDETDMKCDVLHEVCNFKSKKEIDKFLYEEYPLEVFGHAGQIKRNISRDLNQWIQDLTNQEEYDVDIFFYSMKEFNLTIQSSYFFLSKIGTRVRKVIFPRSNEELCEYGDVYITANEELAKYLKGNGKAVILSRMNFNECGEKYADIVIDDFREFLDYDDKLGKITNILNTDELCQSRKMGRLSWTSIKSWILSLPPMKKGTRT